MVLLARLATLILVAVILIVLLSPCPVSAFTNHRVMGVTSNRPQMFEGETQHLRQRVSEHISSPLVAGVMAAAGLCSSAILWSRQAPGRKDVTHHRGQLVTVCSAYDPQQELGAMAPLGFWDPADLMKKIDGTWKDEATFRQFRAAELKHGRVAMMAAIGLLAGTFAKWPGYEDVPGGVAALSTSQGGSGLGILFIIAAWFELYIWKQDPSKDVGDFSEPTKSWVNPSTFCDESLRLKELNNGRLAMSAVFTSLLTEYGTGMGPEQQLEFLTQFKATPAASQLGTVLLLFVMYVGRDAEDGIISPSASALPMASATASATGLITKDSDGAARFTVPTPIPQGKDA